MVSSRPPWATCLAGRALAALGLAAAVLLGPVGPAVSAPADGAKRNLSDQSDPDARIQVVLKQVHIFDDEDTFGEGEIHLLAIVTECVDGQCAWQCVVPNDYCNADGPIFSQARLNFGADSGDRVNLGDRLMPRSDDAVFAATRAALGVSDEAGIPVYAGKRYQFGVLGWENDVGPFDFDTLGYLSADIDESNGWGVGTYTRTSVENDDGNPGSFEMTFEIRRTPLPDLVPGAIRSLNLDDGRPVVCPSVTNRGERDAGPFRMELGVDVAPVPGQTFGITSLAVGEVLEHCFLVPAGQHRYTVTLDPTRQVPEMNEHNNAMAETIALGSAPTGGASPMVGPANTAGDASNAGQADLVVTSLRVRGREPTGSKDCKEGRNDIAVVLKNQGAASASGFALQVVIDDDEVEEKAGLSLDAGKELSVRFEDLRLKKGQHKLRAIADPKNAIGEANEDNNKLEVSARCEDDD
jgi:hypothetical protein